MANTEHKVPVYKTEHSIIDQEFSSIRERFDKEMKRMEEEMNRFRQEIAEREKKFFSDSISHFNTSSSRTTSNYKTSSNNLIDRQTDSQLNSWLDNINSPLVQDSNDGKILKLRFDLTEYAPEEIVVKTIDNKLQVNAKHEEKGENRSSFSSYNREFLLPQGVNPELIRSSLSKDGVLTVEAPLPAIENNREKTIPVQYR